MTVATGAPQADLRSDTVTRPTPAMREAMAAAEVGDAVFGDDPTVNRLQATIAERLGFEAALFVPSGTLANQLAMGVLAGPGEAVLMPEFAHVARWEGGGAAATFGVSLVQVAAPDGLPTLDALAAHAYGAHIKAPTPRALALENTHNWAGGRAYSLAQLEPLTAWAASGGLARHLDGARLFNAAHATGDDAAALVRGFDTVSVCFSKGLGAPVGSALLGSRALIAKADRLRHRLGSGWRQAGILAAAALHALDHHVARLADDHARARALADVLRERGIGRVLHPVETNILQFAVDARFESAAALVARAAERGVLFFATGPRTARLVTHLDFDDAALAHATRVFETL